MSEPGGQTGRTLEGVPVPTRAALLALGVCVAVRCLLLLRPDGLMEISDHYQVRRILDRELESKLNAEVSPKVLIMGTSRMDVSTFGKLAEELGLPAADVRNLSFLGNSFWMNYTLLRRNPELLRAARLVIMDVLPYHLFDSPMTETDSGPYLVYASLGERLRYHRWTTRMKAVADLLFPAWSERRTVYWWRRNASLSSGGRIAVHRALWHEIQSQEMRARLYARTRPDRALNFVLDRYFPAPKPSRFQREALKGLIGLLPPRCTLVLVFFPFDMPLERIFDGAPERRAAFLEFKRYLETLDHPNVRILWFEDPRSYGFEAQDFFEHAHPTPRGYEKLSVLVASAVRDLIADEPLKQSTK